MIAFSNNRISLKVRFLRFGKTEKLALASQVSLSMFDSPFLAQARNYAIAMTFIVVSLLKAPFAKM